MNTQKDVIHKGRFIVTNPAETLEEGHNRRSSLNSMSRPPDEEAQSKHPRQEREAEAAGMQRLSLNEVPRFTASTSQLPDPQPLGKMPVLQKSVKETQSPKNSDIESCRKVPIGLITSLQETLCGQFGEMMELHKSVMNESIARGARRDEQTRMLAEENLELVRVVTRLQSEQSRLRERMYGRD